jgi:transcriptional regulator with XRE-family HTH domain
MEHKTPSENIKRELIRRGITQTQAAFDLNIERSMFNGIAKGWRVPKPAIRAKIAEYLGMAETELFPNS